MRGRTTLTTALLVAGALVAAAPAPASRVPEPVEFERRAPQPPVRAAGGRDALRGVVRTARHFNVVGFRWRGAAASALSVRVRTARGWSRWTEVGADFEDGPDVGAPEAKRPGRGSEPVWAGDADAVQYSLRASGRVRDLRIRFVNTRGTATAADRRRAGARTSAARAIVPAPGVPPIVTREEWGASKCPPRTTPAYGEVQVAFVHHTVTANDYRPSDSAAIVRAMCVYHRNSNGWNDIGYNLLVDRYGQVFEGRAGGIDAPVVGAQAQGYNAQSTGIANLGTFSTTGQTAAGLDALARILSWKLAVHGVPPTGTVQVTSAGGSLNRYPAGRRVTFNRVSGHRDGDATACPGDALYAQLPQIRQMATGGPLPARASLVLRARPRNIKYGSSAALEARLAGPGGSPLPGLRVDLQGLDRLGAWNTLRRLRTDASGAVAASLRLTYNRAVRARFAGGAGLGGAQSKPIAIGVRPRVRARLAPSSATLLRRGSRLFVRGKVKPAKRYALLLVHRVGRTGKQRRIGRRVLRVRSGRARGSFLFARPGSYAVRLAVRADAKNLSARSRPIAITVR